jgi:uridine monophosphate synthetase
MDKAELVRKLHEKGAIKLGAVTLKSEVVVPILVDLRQIIAYPQLLQAVAQLMWDKVHPVAEVIDVLCGVPETTLPIANYLSSQQRKRMLLVRKGNKAYGKKWVEGSYLLGEKCLLMEDAVATGASALATINHLKKTGLYVPHVAAFLDHGHGAHAALDKMDCSLHCVFTQAELLNELKKLGVETPEEHERAVT